MEAREAPECAYDRPEFFEKYSQMSRSKYGLSGAGEWPTLKEMLPDFAGKRLLDLGCGYGWHCVYAMEHGAQSALGLELSGKMLQVAREKTPFPQVEYRQGDMEQAEFEAGSFDVVLSSLALHYIADYDALVRRVHRWLSPGGRFIFTCEHPVFTAQGPQDWVYGPDGQISHFPVDNYYCEGWRKATFLGEPVTKYHRTLTHYVQGLLQGGFELLDLAEPMPPREMMDLPGMKDEMRRPMMLILSARKRAE